MVFIVIRWNANLIGCAIVAIGWRNFIQPPFKAIYLGKQYSNRISFV